MSSGNVTLHPINSGAAAILRACPERAQRVEREESLDISEMSRDYDFWVYIVTNQHDSVLYIGMTNSLARRISEHRSGELPGFTADYRCHKLIYYEHYSNVDEAIERETQLKKWSRAKKVELIERTNPRWLDLFEEISGNN
jgi:putative endonuclease